MMTGLPAVVTMLAGLVLLVLAGSRVRDNGWGLLAWLLVMIAMFAIRTPHALRNCANAVVEARNDRTGIALLTRISISDEFRIPHFRMDVAKCGRDHQPSGQGHARATGIDHHRWVSNHSSTRCWTFS